MAGETLDGVASGLSPAGVRLRKRARWVPRLRLVLGVFWALVAAGLVVSTSLQPQQADLSTLYDDVASGRVASVSLTPGFGPGESGYQVQTATWAVDGLDRTASWPLVIDDGVDDGLYGSSFEDDLGTPVSEDVAAQLERLGPGTAVVDAPRPVSGVEVLGVPLGDGLAVLVLLPFALAWLATMCLMISGPEPYRASRWAWFWLSAPPLGLLVFLVLSGPTPGLGIRRPAGGRLGGGWAFVLGLVLSAVVASPWWW